MEFIKAGIQPRINNYKILPLIYFLVDDKLTAEGRKHSGSFKQDYKIKCMLVDINAIVKM